MRLRPALLLLCAACVAAPAGRDGAAAPAWVAQPDVARTAESPLECFAVGAAPLGPQSARDADHYARAAERALRDAEQRLARRTTTALVRAGLATQRASVLRAVQGGARVKGRFVDGSSYLVWLVSDIGHALDAARVAAGDEQRAALAQALAASAADASVR